MSNDPPPPSLTLVKSGPAVPHVPSFEEYAADMAAVQEALAAAIASRPVKYDPIGLVLGSLSDLAGTLFKTTRRWEQATAAIVAARQPFPQDERDAMVRGVVEATREEVRKGVRGEMLMLIRNFDRKVAAVLGACVGGAFVLGVVLDEAVTYARAPSYQAVTLAGDALLCRASGAVIDASGTRFYPALPVQPAPIARH